LLYLFHLMSTSFGLIVSTANDIMAFDVEDYKGMNWGWLVGNSDATLDMIEMWRKGKSMETRLEERQSV